MCVFTLRSTSGVFVDHAPPYVFEAGSLPGCRQIQCEKQMLSLSLPFTSLPCLIAQRGISNTEAIGVVRADIHGLFQVLWEWQAVCHHHYV